MHRTLLTSVLFLTLSGLASCAEHKVGAIWLMKLSKYTRPDTLTFANTIFGRRFARGFPKHPLASHILPAIQIDTKNQSFEPEFNNIVKKSRTAEDAFNKFKYLLHRMICTESNRWRCCDQYVDPSCASPPAEIKRIMKGLIDPDFGFPMFFLYTWCLKKWTYRKYGTLPETDFNQIKRSCPDPCLGNPCMRVVHGHPEKKCEIVGPLEDDYKCECDEDAVWDANVLTCRLLNPCLRKNPSPCLPENTLRCIAKDDYNVICICKDGFMGRDCSMKRNACIERVNKSLPNGNENCRVNLGNECNPIIGEDIYSCTCRYGYMTSLDIAEDNCLLPVNPCHGYAMPKHFESSKQQRGKLSAIRKRGITCLNGGKCLTSVDLSRAVCVCPVTYGIGALFTGVNCEDPVGRWSTWTDTSPCSPADCSATRYRWRRRVCLDNEGAEAGPPNDSRKLRKPAVCFGASEEVLPCAPAPHCMTLRLPGYLREELFDYKSLYWFVGLTLVQFLASMLIWFIAIPRLIPRDSYTESETEYTTYSLSKIRFQAY
ncbi:hypothetical protein CRM22_001622 [Opisthorchis felineus]|uniref:EGF-like domain-containing protein n=2 Tax=Opisthorchis felineus TaxID=147828 RepID=A0A4S2MFR5_OPIFE|nr:hypothetical protein CRM22_001622 [Opisthorchis felineus]